MWKISNMDPVFKKMQLKEQQEVLALQAPASFASSMTTMQEAVQLHTEIDGAVAGYGFILVFVTQCSEIQALAGPLDAVLVDDGLFWWAYPKKSSKRYQSDISRDSGWQPLGDLGYEGVRQVAIDEDWSALRFRKAKNIKKLTRDASWVMSAEGKERKEVE